MNAGKLALDRAVKAERHGWEYRGLTSYGLYVTRHVGHGRWCKIFFDYDGIVTVRFDRYS